jgi:hypothetical protein
MAAARRRAPILLLGLAIAASAVVLALAQWDVTYFQDTWAFLLDRQDFSAEAFFKPHNEHIVVLPVAITKALLAVFGMTSNTPEQVAMALTLFAAAILLFVYVGRRTGPWVGLIAAVLLLFLGAGWPVLLWPFENEFTLPIVFGLAALLLLDRDDGGGDRWACLALSLAVISGSLGVCFVVAAFVDVVLRRRERGLMRLYLVAVPTLLYLLWYAGWGHESEPHVTFLNLLNSPLYVVEGFASAVGSLAGLNTVPINSPGQSEWGRPLLVALIALAAFGQWRRPGFSRGFWVVSAGAVSYWLLAALNFVPGREASATRYVYAGAVFVLLMAAELLRNWPFSRRALWVAGAVAVLAIGPNLAKMKEGGDWEQEQSVFTRADLAAMEIARGTIAPTFNLASVAISGTASLGVVEAGKYFEAVDRWGSPAYTPEELEAAPALGRKYADIVLGQALPLSTETETGSFSPAGSRGGSCLELTPEEAAGTETKLKPGVTRIEVAPGPAAEFSLRRFATGEYPVKAKEAAGESTTSLGVPEDRATQPWFLKVEASQLVRICR